MGKGAGTGGFRAGAAAGECAAGWRSGRAGKRNGRRRSRSAGGRSNALCNIDDAHAATGCPIFNPPVRESEAIGHQNIGVTCELPTPERLFNDP
jgi:hypothetical protein